MSQLCNSTADEGADKNHPLRCVNGSGSFKLDKSKPNLKFKSKLIDLPNQETAQKMKLAQNVEENLQDMNKELDILIEDEKKELLEKVLSNKRAVGRMLTREIKKEPEVTRARSYLGSRASINRTRSVSPPKDEDLPDFDSEKFTPGYVPKTVKKGDHEYLIVVSGVPDTGLCGKYLGDGSLPSFRRKPTAKKSTPSMDVEKRATVKNNSSSVDVEKPFYKTPKMTAKGITSSVDVENPSIFAASPKTNTKKNSFSVDVETSSTSTVTPKTTAESTPVNVEKSPSLEPERSFKKTPGDMPGGGLKKKPEQVQVEETPQLKRTAMAPDPRMSAFPAKYTPETSALPANFQLLKDQTKRKLDLLSQSGLTITPHGPSEANCFSTSSEARETTGLIHVGAARSPGDMTGHIQDGDTTASRGNSPGNNGSGDANECVNCGATDQRTNCGATHQRTRSQGNITVKIGGGDLTLNTGGLTAQMKISDVNITGPADDVANFVTKLSNVVLPRINE